MKRSANTPIVQANLSQQQIDVAARAMPGMQPVGSADWITTDDAYTQQLDEKSRLLSERPDDVLQILDGAKDALDELLFEVLKLLDTRPNFKVSHDSVERSDGITMLVDKANPLQTLSQLIQEDICILQKDGHEHVLTAALLCFPASWTLREKIGKPLIRIHRPVENYDEAIAKRVQRLFDGVQVGVPMWRANNLGYVDPALYHPRSEDNPRDEDHINATFYRSERQTVWRLPDTKAVVFAIHTTIAPMKP